MNSKKFIWYALYIGNWLLILGYWLTSNLAALELGGFNLIIALGRAAGLAAAYMILVQFFLMGRNIWLERTFGLDKLSKKHARSGKIAFYFIVAHPLLLIYGYAGLGNVSWWQQFLMFTQSDDVMNAIIAVLLLVVVISCSIYISRRRLKYETWYYVHLLVYVAVFMAYGHQFELGTDIVSKRWFYGYWLALYMIVLASHVVFRIARPIVNYYRFKWTVEKVVPEPSNVTSVYIKGDRMERFKSKPGQFIIVRFLSKGFSWQAHPFSLSKITDANGIRISVKALGDFTNEIKKLPVGAKAIVDGPYGVFTDEAAVKNKALMIAGGIGITPLRAIMEKMISQGKDVVFLNAIQTRNDIVFKDELDGLMAKGLKMTSVMSKESPDYAGEKGFVDEEKIKRLVPDFVERDVFLCGPPPMMNILIALFGRLGVPKKQVHFEKFEL